MAGEKQRRVGLAERTVGQAATIILLFLAFLLNSWLVVAFVVLALLLGAFGVIFAPYRLLYLALIKPTTQSRVGAEEDRPLHPMLIEFLVLGFAVITPIAERNPNAVAFSWFLVWVVIVADLLDLVKTLTVHKKLGWLRWLELVFEIVAWVLNYPFLVLAGLLGLSTYNVGYHVAGWGALIPNWRAQHPVLAEQVTDYFLEMFTKIGLPNVRCAKAERVFLSGVFSEGRPHLVVRQRVSQGIRSVTTTILVVISENAVGGLRVGWLWFERDRATPLRWWIWAALVVFLGVVLKGAVYDPLYQAFNWTYYYTGDYRYYVRPEPLLSPILWGFVIASYLAGRAVGLWGLLYKRSPADPYERFDSSVLANYVDATLRQVLLQLGVDASEMKELQFTEESWVEERRVKI